MRVRALIALAVVALAASHLTATSDRPAPRTRPSQRDVAATPAPTRTPVPPRLGRAVIDRQDRSSRRDRARESQMFDSRPLLTQLPLELAGVRIDIAGLAADRETTLLSIDPGTRSRAHARAIYQHALAAYRDSGHAYEPEWARRAARRPSGSEDGTP
jgi:hypothetical protein